VFAGVQLAVIKVLAVVIASTILFHLLTYICNAWFVSACAPEKNTCSY